MNRHEVEKRLIQLEARVRFIMHTLALTRKDNQSGTMESRTFDTLFEEAMKHDMDGANLAQLAQRTFASPGPPTGPPSADGPDGFPRADSDDQSPKANPSAGDG
tara:strand:+ start:1997 stop:2308 length:312 start_codon:yes stop_codon:yes gene_type:complete